MKKIFTRNFITNHRGCYSIEQVKKLSFINNKQITIEDILASEISLNDKYWFVMNSCNLNYDKRTELRSNIRMGLSPQWVWVVDVGYGWTGDSLLPASEKRKALNTIKKYFK